MTHRKSKYSFEQWEACRIDFITGKGSARWCAQKHQINYRMVLARCYKDDWVKQRDDWFREKRLRDSVPVVAAALNPPAYAGETPLPQPLSPDFFLHHANRHHANLDPIGDQISENWKMLKGEKEDVVLTIEQRTAVLRETRELIALQRQLLGIPNVAPIRRPSGENIRNKSGSMGDLDLTKLRSANAQRERIPHEEEGIEEGLQEGESQGDEEVYVRVERPQTRQPKPQNGEGKPPPHYHA